MLEIGVPVWTSGQFTRKSALDDLGLESVGAGLLRRLIPGVVQTTGNAGYYSFYPYLLAKWEDEHESVSRADFKPFYRRYPRGGRPAFELGLCGYNASLTKIQ